MGAGRGGEGTGERVCVAQKGGNIATCTRAWLALTRMMMMIFMPLRLCRSSFRLCFKEGPGLWADGAIRTVPVAKLLPHERQAFAKIGCQHDARLAGASSHLPSINCTVCTPCSAKYIQYSVTSAEDVAIRMPSRV